MDTFTLTSWIKTKSFRSTISLFIAAFALVWCFQINIKRASAACPTVRTWTGSGVDNKWTRTANWDLGAGCPIAAGDSIVFPSSALQPTSLNDTAGQAYNSITFLGTGYTINQGFPGAFTPLTAGIDDQATGGTNIISMDMRLAGPQNFSVDHAGETLQINGLTKSVDLNNHTLTFQGPGNITMIHAIEDTSVSPTGGVIITNAAQVGFYNDNTYAGTTTINNNSSLQIDTNNGLGTADGTAATATTVNSGGMLSIVGPGIHVGNELLTLNGQGPSSNGAFAIEGGSSIWDGNVVLASDTSFNFVGPSDSLTINGVVSGSGGFTKINDGTLILTGANTYTGFTDVAAGTLDVESNTALGTSASGTTIENGAALYIHGDGLDIANESLTLNGGTNALSSDLGTNTWGGPITLALDSNIDIEAGVNLFLTGSIGGPAGFIKEGTGDLKLLGPNTYSGITNIDQGQISDNAGPNYVFQNTDSGVVINTGATLDLSLSGGGDTIGSLHGTGDVVLGSNNTLTVGSNNQDTNFAGIISDTTNGGLTKIGTGTFTMYGPNTYHGITTVNNGTLALQSSLSLGAGDGTPATGTVVNSGGTLLINGATFLDMANEALTLNGPGYTDNGALWGSLAVDNAWEGPITLGSDSTINVDDAAGSLAFNGVVSGLHALNKVGPGELRLSGVNTYAGPTNLHAGDIKLKNSNALPVASDLVIDSGALFNLNDYNQTINSLSGNGGVTLLGASVFTINGSTSTTFNGVLGGSGGLVKQGSGTLTLTGNNNYTGPTRVNAGTLFVNGSQSASAVAVNTGGILAGTGTVGDLTVIGGTVSPGGNNTAQFHTGNVSFDGASTLIAQINGINPGTDYDQLHASGHVHLDGTLQLTAVPFLPISETFGLVTSPTASDGTFAAYPPGFRFVMNGNSFVSLYPSGAQNGMGVETVAPPVPPVTGGAGGGGYTVWPPAGSSSSGGGSSSPAPAPAPVPPAPPASPTPPPASSLHSAAPETSTQNTTDLHNFFLDTSGHWAEQQIDEILNTCKVAGYADQQGNLLRLFKPDNQLTRAELLTMLMKCKEGLLPPLSQAPFPDVPSNHWAAQYIQKGVELGIIKGYSDGTFKPNQTITRDEALKIILLAWFTPDDINAAPQSSTCADVASTSWYAPYFYFALNKGFLGGSQGSSTVYCRPENLMTRAESATSIIKVRLEPVASGPSNLAIRVTGVKRPSHPSIGVDAPQFAGTKTPAVTAHASVKVPHKVKRTA